MSKAVSLAYSKEELQNIAQELVRQTMAAGAGDCEVQVSENWGLNVGVRSGEVDTVTHHQGCQFSVTAYVSKRRGRASSNSFTLPSMQDTAAQAVSIAKLTAEDPYAGLPEAGLLCNAERELDLFHPWKVNMEEAIDIARRCEQAGFATSPQISKSEGAVLTTSQGGMVLANNLGFCMGQMTTNHSLRVSLIASAGQEMEQDGWLSRERCADDLASPEAIGKYAAQRVLSRLHARTLHSVRTPVIFEAPVASTLIRAFVHAASGTNLYRKASFLTNRLGDPLFPAWLTIQENPHLPRQLASANFDGDGVATQVRDVVQDGVLKGYFLSVYSGRKLNMRTTGNSGGAHNLIVQHQEVNLPAMIRHIDRGLLVTDLLGHGINYVTGDYSYGAAGYWIEKGEIAYPVHEITLAGNLRDMYRGIVSIANDVVNHHGIETGSILIEEMGISGPA